MPAKYKKKHITHNLETTSDLLFLQFVLNARFVPTTLQINSKIKLPRFWTRNFWSPEAIGGSWRSSRKAWHWTRVTNCTKQRTTRSNKKATKKTRNSRQGATGLLASTMNERNEYENIENKPKRRPFCSDKCGQEAVQKF